MSLTGASICDVIRPAAIRTVGCHIPDTRLQPIAIVARDVNNCVSNGKVLSCNDSLWWRDEHFAKD